MPPPNDGNEYLPFVDMIALEKINTVTYRSIALPFAPGDTGRAYGGHVYAQAVWAAAQTVQSGFVIHNVTGFFILAGLTTVPFIYNVKTIRDGRSYCTRIVNVTQAEGKGICFTCTCSFKRPEESELDVQEKIDLEATYSTILKGKSPEDWEEAPGADVPSYVQRMKETGYNDPCPGVHTRKVDMAPYNKSRSPTDRRQLYYYQVIGSLPPDPNIHACAHLYNSDRNSLFVVGNHLDIDSSKKDVAPGQMASLSHSVVFHVSEADIMMQEEGENNRKLWFCKEDWMTRAAGGRGIHNSRVVGPGGIHIASTWQEGVVRFGMKPTSNKSGKPAKL